MNRLLIVIDGNSLMHRAFHAIGDLDDASGRPTNAIYGFTSMLLKVLAERDPSHLAVAFDMHGPTFRHDAFADYKGTRKPTDERLVEQFPRVKAMLGEMQIPVLEMPGYEADDILGTLAREATEAGMPALLVTGDRDALQLVSDSAHVLYTRRGISDTVEFDPAGVLEAYGVTPAQVPDLKGLMGDSSDNIPGVPGVGEKTGVRLLAQYGTIAATLDHADEQKGKLRERLETYRAQAEQSHWLATICVHVPLVDGLDSYQLGDLAGGREAFAALDFKSLMPRLEKLVETRGGGTAEAPPAETPAQTQWGSAQVLASLEAIAAWVAPRPEAALVWGDALTLAAADGWASIPLQQDLLCDGLNPDDAFRALAPLFERRESLRVFDAKQLLHSLEGFGLRFGGACIHDDVMLSGFLLDPLAPAKKLSDLVEGEANAPALWDLSQRHVQALDEAGMTTLYREMELPLMRVLLDMERDGFLVDRPTLQRLGDKFSAEESQLREEIISLTGGEAFNINSTQQLAQVLFGRLGLPPGRKTKSGYSTDAETLEGLRGFHPVIEKILDYRQVAKLNATYIDGLTTQIESDGRIRTRFDQTVAVTGRLSSNEPNLQNIPVRTAMGREIRRAFIAREDWTLVDADYSQIELRILAHLSGDPDMVDAFCDGDDIHARTAAQVYGVPIGEVTPAMRSASKAVNFGIVYGISDYGLARNIGVTRKEAAEFIARYFSRYPGVKKYMDKAVADGKALGYAQTMFGRRRPLPELSSGNYNTRAFGERAAMNTPVQGAAADIIKLAMVHVHERLQKEGLEARLILQVHDELIVECPQHEAETVDALVRDCMETVAALKVPLVADVHNGKTWYDAK